MVNRYVLRRISWESVEAIKLMEGKFRDQGYLDQDLGEWLYPRVIQPNRGLFYEE